MPIKQWRPCATPGCAGLTRAGRYCAGCKPNDARATAAARGYGAAWQRYRVMFLRANPLCVDPFGRHAAPVPATDVDHIQPLNQGGSNAESNLQSLCHACHSTKTRAAQLGGQGGAETYRVASQTARPTKLHGRENRGGGV